MIILHGSWIENQFVLWGEGEPGDAMKGRRGRPPRKPGMKPHPFQAGREELAKALKDIYPRAVWKGPLPLRSFWLKLPTDRYFPQGSPGVLTEEPENEIGLAEWEITGIALSPALFIEKIVSGFQGKMPEDMDDVKLADDWQFWIHCGWFLIRLLCRQKFVPSLAAAGSEQARAVWLPVLEDPEDRKTLRNLIEAMPPVCWAPVKEPDGEPVYKSPKDAMMDFLFKATDELIRHWLVDMDSKEENLPIERKWLIALHSKNRILGGNRNQIKKLAEGIRKWTAPLRENQGNFRTCFYLKEPRNSKEKWHLSFHFQAADDPDLLVAADEIWKMSEESAVFMNRPFERPQERFLEDLGKAMKIFPPIERALDTARPAECSLSEDEAYRFLKEVSVLLQGRGFGVILPEWWREKNRRKLGLRLELRPIEKEGQGEPKAVLGLESLVEYNWKISLGNQTIEYEELRRLAAQRKPLIKAGDQWVELDINAIKGIFKWLEDHHQTGTAALGEILRFAAGKTDFPAVHSIQATGWISGFLHGPREELSFRLLDTPEGFQGVLRPYQIRGLSWLAFMKVHGLGACLADDMGLGKTIQVIALILHEHRNRESEGAVLLICPTSLVGNWYKEFNRFAPGLKLMIHHGSERLSGDEFIQAVSKVDVVISTYNLVYRDIDTLAGVRWRGIILDEAQNIKNANTKQAAAVRKCRGGYRIALTGTPVENRLQELWAIMDFLNPGYLGSREKFRHEFAIPIEKYGSQEKTQTLRQLTQPFILRRLKTDPTIIQDLPEKQEMKVYCSLSREQVFLYQETVRELMENIQFLDGIKRRGRILAALTRLKQICNHPALIKGEAFAAKEDSGKLDRLTSMLEEVLDSGEKALIFTQYAKMGKILMTFLARRFQREVLFLHGGLPKKKRDEMISRFQRDDGPDLFVLSLRAGGLGLNLTKANHVFHYDRWWNPAVENQATDRAFRIGQTKNVQVHKFICTGTLEEKIEALIEQKKFIAEQVIGSGEAWLTELSNEELRKLIELDRNMLVEE